MKEQSAMTDKIIKKLVKKIVDPTPWEWPPQCIGFMYQPVRPHQSVVYVENLRRRNAKEPS